MCLAPLAPQCHAPLAHLCLAPVVISASPSGTPDPRPLAHQCHTPRHTSASLPVTSGPLPPPTPQCLALPPRHPSASPPRHPSAFPRPGTPHLLAERVSVWLLQCEGVPLVQPGQGCSTTPSSEGSSAARSAVQEGTQWLLMGSRRFPSCVTRRRSNSICVVKKMFYSLFLCVRINSLPSWN